MTVSIGFGVILNDHTLLAFRCDLIDGNGERLALTASPIVFAQTSQLPNNTIYVAEAAGSDRQGCCHHWVVRPAKSPIFVER